MSRWILTLLLLPLSLYAGDFDQVMPGKSFSFPRDHGAHPNYPVEWWYFTGHLETAEKRTFGFELTFFRVAVERTERKREGAWHVQSLYLAHAAVTDDKGQRFFFEKRTRRPTFGQAGASTEGLLAWLDDWRVEQGDDGGISLKFSALSQEQGTPFSVSLNLRSKKAPVLQGEDGYSRKGKAEGDASYYVSFTRLLGDGALRIDGEEFSVSASAWMDHEVLSSEPNNEEVGWDWFSIQLDNGWECMLYHLYRNREVSPFSAGGCVDPDGVRTSLALSDYRIEPLSTWKSPTTGITYPMGWKVSILPVELSVTVTPTMKAQELISREQVSRTYWEGRSTVRGTQSSVSVSGNAYVELVGYKK